LFRFFGILGLPFQADYLSQPGPKTPGEVKAINPLIDSFQHLYNHHRPHGAFGGKTRACYLSERTKGSLPSHKS
jgi:hypothetical protein